MWAVAELPPVAILAALGSFITALLGILGFVVRRIITGDLVPRATYADILADRNDWRDLALELNGQNNLLIENGHTTVEAVRAIRGHVVEEAEDSP